MAAEWAPARREGRPWRTAATGGQRGGTVPSRQGHGGARGLHRHRGPARTAEFQAAGGEAVVVADEGGLAMQHPPRVVCRRDHPTLLRSRGGVAGSERRKHRQVDVVANIRSASVNSTVHWTPQRSGRDRSCVPVGCGSNAAVAAMSRTHRSAAHLGAVLSSEIRVEVSIAVPPLPIWRPPSSTLARSRKAADGQAKP
jgi:hypothetical protein